MPRLEIIENPDAETSPTIDICNDCFDKHVTYEGMRIAEILPNEFAPLSEIGSEDVDHPSYCYEEYSCHICKTRLCSKDDHPVGG